jgi:transposase
MVTVSNTTVPREAVWRALRQTHDARLRERYHCILLLLDGKSCPAIARWLYRKEDTIRNWVHAFNQTWPQPAGSSSVLVNSSRVRASHGTI